jgi:hypothetical protein
MLRYPVYKCSNCVTVTPISLLSYSLLLVYIQRYDSYYTKHGSQDTHTEGDDFGSLQDSDIHDKQDKKAFHGAKHRQTFQSNATRFPGRNSPLDLYEDSTGEAAYNIAKNHRKDIKRGVEGMRSDSASNHSDHYEENLAVKHADFDYGAGMLSNETMVSFQHAHLSVSLECDYFFLFSIGLTSLFPCMRT